MLLESTDSGIREAALGSLLSTTELRGERNVRALSAITATPDTGRRTIYDCRTTKVLTSAVLARTEDGAPSKDRAVNQAFDGFGKTRDFYKQVLSRNSIDDRGMRLNGFVHYGSAFQNAFWDGQEMIFGDGDGKVFGNFTGSIDVIAHELTHGVTEYTANLRYHGQSGALNESISDVFGSLVKQWTRNETAAAADWLIGAEIFTPGLRGDALRSMKAPGTAYDNDLIGRDPQPDHMDKFVILPDTPKGDYAGVHVNSGIPNKAFYLTATAIGGPAWEAPGHIWYESLKASGETTDFQQFATTTYQKAGQLYGSNSAQQRAVLEAWREVGIRVSGASARGGGGGAGGAHAAERDGESESFAALARHVKDLAEQVEVLLHDVATLKQES
ncbi:MAG TPA: M4 family metallopeptidase [Longimicrobium sp.]|jgi:Zn-dependent metalloprotease